MDWSAVSALAALAASIVALGGVFASYVQARTKEEASVNEEANNRQKLEALDRKLNDHILEDARIYVRSQELHSLEERLNRRLDGLESTIRSLFEKLLRPHTDRGRQDA